MSFGARETRIWVDQIQEDQVSAKWVKPSAQAVNEHQDLYEVAYDQAVRALDDQIDELGGARTRAVQFLAFASSATAFLATAVLGSAGSRALPFYILSGLGTLLALGAVGCVAALLRPRATVLYGRMDPRIIIEGYIERDVPVPNKAELLRELSLHLSKWKRANNQSLILVRRLYFWSVVCGGLQVIAWAVLTWVAR